MSNDHIQITVEEDRHYIVEVDKEQGPHIIETIEQGPPGQGIPIFTADDDGKVIYNDGINTYWIYIQTLIDTQDIIIDSGEL